ncbi:acyl-CoA mutase large subunit family protein [Paenibacillus thalictri]|uniref:Methylmalonyl-CoA mutase n=1 Tax=Paenibacillus thalictri TaxID=2527873 RepID=A0A4Q9DWK8_9BACL|nr:methylmalonyl-CoA mutase family protein [Paenibacillus thalictri]TBL80389.1 methylmalonyl-CoA mutase [Paenibacillus thalictri]
MTHPQQIGENDTDAKELGPHSAPATHLAKSAPSESVSYAFLEPHAAGENEHPGQCASNAFLEPHSPSETERAGHYPYTRGIHSEMYRAKLWTMRQYTGFGTAEKTNRRLHYLLKQGQTGLSLAFDLPTQLGLDPNDPLAAGEVGKVGVSVCSLADMEILLKDIPLGEISASMTINAPAAIVLAMYCAVAEQRGIPLERLSGTVQNDMLKEYVARGTYIFPPEPSIRLAVDVIEHCVHALPRWNPISVSGYHLREAGATAAQEIAFTLAHGAAYVEAAVKRGIPVDIVAPRFTFFFAAGLRLLEEAAKLRAARRLWARLMKRRFAEAAPKALQLRVHAQTSGSALTAQQPENNAARVALQALGAVFGGVQSLHTNACDEALGLPTEQTARTALRTQQIIAYESGVAEVCDPLAGSVYVEALTDRLEAEAADHLQRIERLGGPLAALRSGYMRSQIHQAAYDAQLNIDRQQTVIVGLNRFTGGRSFPLKRFAADPDIAERQLSRLAQLRQNRDNGKTAALLHKLKQAAGSDQNLIPYITDCVKAYATIGEICGALKEIFGEYEEV